MYRKFGLQTCTIVGGHQSTVELYDGREFGRCTDCGVYILVLVSRGTLGGVSPQLSCPNAGRPNGVLCRDSREGLHAVCRVLPPGQGTAAG